MVFTSTIFLYAFLPAFLLVGVVPVVGGVAALEAAVSGK